MFTFIKCCYILLLLQLKYCAFEANIVSLDNNWTVSNANKSEFWTVYHYTSLLIYHFYFLARFRLSESPSTIWNLFYIWEEHWRICVSFIQWSETSLAGIRELDIQITISEWVMSQLKWYASTQIYCVFF